MYFDRRLWALTKGVRGRVALGVLARLALLGWLLALLFQGAAMDALIEPAALVAAVMLARGGLEYLRAMLAHHTAALVQVNLRKTIYDQVVALGPAHFGRERTGDVVLSMVEGVEQLETYFGQYLPQLFVAALTPILIFAFLAWLDLPIATILLVAALATLIAPAAWHRMDSRNSIERQKAYGAFGAEFLDSLQGLVTLKAFGQSGARAQLLAKKAHDLFQTTMWVLGTNTLARGITDAGIAIGATVALGWGAFRVVEGTMPLSTLLIILMLGVEVFRPLRELRSLLHQGMVGLSAAQGIFDILGAKPAIADAAAPGTERLEPSVTFDDVVFGYPGGRRQALRGLSFTVRAGERVGIVHDLETSSAPLRSARRRDPRGRQGSARNLLARSARADRRGQPGQLPVPWHHRRQSAHGPPRGDASPARRGRTRGQRP
jgi:ATP-binding cassette, subfamily B, bacterial